MRSNDSTLPEELMIRSSRTLLAGALLAATAMLGTTHPAAAQAKQAPSPDVAYRKSVMDGLVSHVMSLRALLGNDIGHEPDIRKHTAALLANASMLDGIFAPGTAGAGSNAKEDVWAKSDDFKAKMKEFQDAARTLDQEAAKGQERTVLSPRLQMVIGTCGGCHTAFKLPAPLPF
jgi:cytochrome c556